MEKGQETDDGRRPLGRASQVEGGARTKALKPEVQVSVQGGGDSWSWLGPNGVVVRQMTGGEGEGGSGKT